RSSKARRCSGVCSESWSKLTSWLVRRMRLRVRVASASSRSRRLWAGRLFSVRFVAAFAFARSERQAGAADNRPAFTAPPFRARVAELGIAHRRGGYRDPESQAFIESWFGKLKEREVWLNEYETLDDARRGIGGYVDHSTSARTAGSTTGRPWRCVRPGEDLQKLAA